MRKEIDCNFMQSIHGNVLFSYVKDITFGYFIEEVYNKMVYFLRSPRVM